MAASQKQVTTQMVAIVLLGLLLVASNIDIAVAVCGVEVDGVLEELGTLKSVSVLLLVVVSIGKVDSSLDLWPTGCHRIGFRKPFLTFVSEISILTILRQGLRNQMLYQHRLDFHYRLGSSPIMACLNQAGSRHVYSPPRLVSSH
ncbi:hypothetical protein RND71_040399 [Anisodus tanguticus]|uniref:Uncharacterized protein n=1 Tax=Anisodus tanguticus TaxID=243964 RepID=A0AAE1QVI5_9SOLA|nr:hypothetical protein RND71_040399 [Anisodus tanguticus]